MRKSTFAILLAAHGHILSAGTTAKVMGFASTDALRFARVSGRLSVPMFLVEGRRGWFAATEDVAAWLDQTIAGRLQGADKQAAPQQAAKKQQATAE